MTDKVKSEQGYSFKKKKKEMQRLPYSKPQEANLIPKSKTAIVKFVI